MTNKFGHISRYESCSIQGEMVAASSNQTWFSPEGLPIIYVAHVALLLFCCCFF